MWNKNKDNKDNNSKPSYTIKQHLNNSDFAKLISMVVEYLMDDERNEDRDEPIPYYLEKNMVINRFTIDVYTDIEDIEDYNTYEVIQNIKNHIDNEQYTELKECIDEGIKYELHKKSANFGLGEISPEAIMAMIPELQGMMDKIGSDPTIAKVVGIGNETQALKMAQAEVQKEMKAKKTKRGE